MPRRPLLLVPLVVALVLTGCATADEPPPKAPGLDPGHTLVVIPPRADRPRVEVSEEQFREAMRVLLPHVRFPLHLGANARAQKVVRVAFEPLSHEELALARDYRAWCERRHRQPGDCLGLLRGKPVLGQDGRYKIAFDIALGSQWDGFAAELGGLVDPAVVRVTLLSALVGYMALIAFPELVTKGVAAGLALALTAYIGADAMWNLVAGWIQMVAEADAARTFSQLRAAGERYGRVVGAQTARLLVMLVTAVVAEGGMAAKLLALPGAAQAQLRLAADVNGLGLAAVEQASSVLVAADGVTIALAPAATGAQALAMAAKKSGSESKPNARAAPPAPDEDPDRGYPNFDAFKKANGPAGEGKVWHHIVEQHKDNVAKFGPESLHSRRNVIRLDYELHLKVNGHYSSKQNFSGDKIVREWLKPQDYKAQREFGLNYLRRLGVKLP
jgi:hypothetical protein